MLFKHLTPQPGPPLPGNIYGDMTASNDRWFVSVFTGANGNTAEGVMFFNIYELDQQTGQPLSTTPAYTIPFGPNTGTSTTNAHINMSYVTSGNVQQQYAGFGSPGINAFSPRIRFNPVNPNQFICCMVFGTSTYQTRIYYYDGSNWQYNSIGFAGNRGPGFNYSPDGTKLACVANGQITIFSIVNNAIGATLQSSFSALTLDAGSMPVDVLWLNSTKVLVSYSGFNRNGNSYYVYDLSGDGNIIASEIYNFSARTEQVTVYNGSFGSGTGNGSFSTPYSGLFTITVSGGGYIKVYRGTTTYLLANYAGTSAQTSTFSATGGLFSIDRNATSSGSVNVKVNVTYTSPFPTVTGLTRFVRLADNRFLLLSSFGTYTTAPVVQEYTYDPGTNTFALTGYSDENRASSDFGKAYEYGANKTLVTGVGYNSLVYDTTDIANAQVAISNSTAIGANSSSLSHVRLHGSGKTLIIAAHGKPVEFRSV